MSTRARRNLTAALAGLVALSLVAGIIFYLFATSVGGALSSAGVRGDREILWEGIDPNDDRILVVSVREPSTDSIVVAHLVHGGWRRWSVIQTSRPTDDALGEIAWTEFHGGRGYGQELIVNSASHRVVAGSNALKLIGDLDAEVPGGIAVNIRQDRHLFVIHLIGFDRFGENQPDSLTSVLYGLDIREILERRGEVSAS